jgi:acyl-CoA synthetase (AMP-forming)/AMP-acid ligase II
MAERALEHAASVDTVYDLLSSEYRGPALIDVNGTVIDHPTLRSEVDRLASELRALGLGAGDRIAIVLPNGPEMVFALLAAMAVGCAAPLNPKYREDEFRFYLDDLDAAALLAFEGSADEARAATPDKTIVIDEHTRAV